MARDNGLNSYLISETDFTSVADTFDDICIKVQGQIPPGYELVSCDIKLSERKYYASFALKQSLVSKIKLMKTEFVNTRRNPVLSGYLLDEIIRELEKK